MTLGKKTFLVNTVWMENPPTYDAVLKEIDQIICRDLFSCVDLKSNHAMDSRLAPDLSCLSMSAEERHVFLDSLDRRNDQLIFTDFYSPEFGGWVKYTACKFNGFKTVDMSKLSWASLLSTMVNLALL